MKCIYSNNSNHDPIDLDNVRRIERDIGEENNDIDFYYKKGDKKRSTWAFKSREEMNEELEKIMAHVSGVNISTIIIGNQL
jgi:hypothetical protein